MSQASSTNFLRKGSLRSSLDPACGSGNLLFPWKEQIDVKKIVGLDNDLALPIIRWIEQFYGNFETFVPDFQPDLILCNPPWSGHWKRHSYPEVFFNRIITLFGEDVPLVFLCPMGFRLNLKLQSKRRQRFLRHGPEISSIISCPLDMYPDTLFHSEILMFNIPKLKPHYWLPNEQKENFYGKNFLRH